LHRIQHGENPLRSKYQAREINHLPGLILQAKPNFGEKINQKWPDYSSLNGQLAWKNRSITLLIKEPVEGFFQLLVGIVSPFGNFLLDTLD
jgi:hypothetical protein